MVLPNADDVDAMRKSVSFKLLLLCYKSPVAAQMYKFNICLLPNFICTTGTQMLVCEMCEFCYSSILERMCMGNAVTVDMVKRAKEVHDREKAGECSLIG